MACDCDSERLVFSVPPDLVDHAPERATTLSICPQCLDLDLDDAAPDEVPSAPDFSRIVDGFPDGETGAAMALAVGLLVDSVALNREDIAACFERVSDGGDDPWLVLERLAVTPTVTPKTDLDRARRQLDQLIG